MLEAIRVSLDGLSEQESKHYVQKDGKFVLDVGAVDGLALENVDGLKKTVEQLRATERRITAELEKYKADFEGIDAQAVKDAMAKMDEIKNWDKDTRVKEAIEANKRDLVKAHDTKVNELNNELKAVTTQLQEALVESKIVEALQTEKGNVELLLPHVRKFVQMKKGGDGKFYPEVVDEQGTPRVGDTSGNAMSILQKVQEMKGQKSFAPAFEGANSTGSGNAGGVGGGTPKSTGTGVTDLGGGHVSVVNLEDVASGKTTVNM